jgi:hypothetical protein
LDPKKLRRYKFKQYKERVLPAGSPARASFEYLCLLGCNERRLFGFLVLAVLAGRSNQTIYDLFGISQKELAKLPDELDRLSANLGSVTRLLYEYLKARHLQPGMADHMKSHYMQQMDLYQSTPRLLRVLAVDLRIANSWIAKNLGRKRYDTLRHSVLQLLQYINNSTNGSLKGPHYDEVAKITSYMFMNQEKDLLDHEHLFPTQRAAQIEKNNNWEGAVPKLLSSPDAQKALFQRASRYGFRKA